MKIIVNADDFGMSDTINWAIVEAFRMGWVTNTTIMVNMPFADQAVQLAKENGFFNRVGLHLNLSHGKPLTTDISKDFLFCNEQGNLQEIVRRKLITQFFIRRDTQRALTLEVKSQMQKYIDYGFPLMHIDSHSHFHTIPSVYAVIRPLILEYKFQSMRLSKNIYSRANIVMGSYKYICNSLVQCMPMHFSDYFTSFADFSVSWSKCKEFSCVELMCHPDYENNVLVNKNSMRFEDLFAILPEHKLISYQDFNI